MLTILFLAIALSADGFAVSICRGAGTSHKWRNAIWTGLVFGVFHALAIVIGWHLGDILEAWKDFAPYIACLILVMLGGKMLWESNSVTSTVEQAVRPPNVLLALFGLLGAAIATSIDGVAAGVALPLAGFSLWIDALLIGCVTSIFCTLGYRMGALVGSTYGKYAEIIGGIILIVIGLKFVLWA